MNFFSSHKPLSEQEQKTALAELRSAIEASTSGSGPSVYEQLRQGGEPGLYEEGRIDDLTYGRWLRAENYNVKKAATRLREHAAWRVKYVPHGSIPEADVQRELDTGKAYVQGFDKHGRPLTICTGRLHSKAVRDLDETKRFICYTLDAALRSNDIKRNPEGKICSIFDLRGMSMDSIDAAVLRAVFDLLANHYPERLGKLWMLDAPGIFYALWKVVSPFVDSVTKAKIEFVDGKKAMDEFRVTIGMETLPKALGGDAELVPVKKVAEQNAPHEASAAH
ncbi:hypothetical protein WJX73_007072 [Symbiochloris irregularis]|uniref:CRAL-TRIO domain-containing protein n=1 Tax=Symbiochloris irregularis TaxID=706552 RepID=A0AAW1NXB9_9CHLO